MNLLPIILTTTTVYVAPTGNDACDGSQTKPVATLARAVELTRSILRDEPKVIELADGTYFMEEAVTLDQKDYDLTIRAKNKGKAILTGAVLVSGWRQDPKDDRFLVADFPFPPEQEMLYTLVVNGKMADFSAYPQFGGDRTLPYLASSEDAAKKNHTVLQYDGAALPAGFDFRDLDLTSAWIYFPQEWATTKSYILTNDWQNNTFVLKGRTAMPIGQFNQGYQVINTRLGLTGPGRWMFEGAARQIVYWPRAGESPEAIHASISKTRCAISMWPLVRGLTISGLVFEGFSSPLNYAPYDFVPYPAALGGKLENGRISDCEFRFSAGEGMTFIKAYRVSVERCMCHDIGGTGINLIDSGRGESSVEWCDVHHIGLFQPGACAIGFQIGPDCRCVGNEVHDTPGPGVVVWSSSFLFASNHVYRTMRALRDAGGLYGAYDHSMIRDNYFHDNGNWSAMYCDEGGQQTVFTGNRVVNSFWPFHLHDTWGIVVTNNTFEFDGPMRYSFEGSVRGIFSNNVLRTSAPVTECEYLEGCDVWADNPVFVRNTRGEWTFCGMSTLPREPVAERPTAHAVRTSGPFFDKAGRRHAEVFRTPGKLRVYMDRKASGERRRGKPFAELKCGYDDDYLYIDGAHYYGRFTPYDGSVNAGEVWGRHDAVRLLFGDFSVTVFLSGKVVSSDPSLVFDSTNSVARIQSWTGGMFALRIPLSRFGLDGRTVEGKEIPFNAVYFNGDHREYLYFLEPAHDGSDRLSKLKFESAVPDVFWLVKGNSATVGGPNLSPCPAWPLGRLRASPETSVRPSEGAAVHCGYDNRHGYLQGMSVQHPGSGGRTLGDLLLTPVWEADGLTNAVSVRMEKSCERSDCLNGYDLPLARWLSGVRSVPSERSLYLRFFYNHGGRVSLVLNPSAASSSADGVAFAPQEILSSGVTLTNGVLYIRNRIRECGARHRDVYAVLAVSPKPTSITDLPARGALPQRYALNFDLNVSGAVTVKIALSEKDFAAARADMDADGASLDFERALKRYESRWDALMGSFLVSGDTDRLTAFYSGIFNAISRASFGNGEFTFTPPKGKPLAVRVRDGSTGSTSIREVRFNGRAITSEQFDEIGILSGGMLELILQ